MKGRAATLTWLWPLALLALPVNVTAQEAPQVVGTMTGLLDDEPREWFILRQGGESNATFTAMGDQVLIDMVGFTEPDQWRVRESLSLSITLIDAQVAAFDVLLPIGATAKPPAFTSENADLLLAIDAFEIQGNKARIVGRLEGTLAVQQSLDEAPMLEEGVITSVEFDAELSRIEY